MKVLFLVALLFVGTMAALPSGENFTEEEYNIFTKLKDFIAHYGHEAIDFIKCMGPKSIEDCGTKIVGCIGTHNPLTCIGALTCEEKDAKLCVHLLKEKAAPSTKKP